MDNNNRKRETERLMDLLLHSVSKSLLKKVQEGTASNQDISNAIKLLHNNGITVEVKQGEPLAILSEDLPFISDHLTLKEQ